MIVLWIGLIGGYNCLMNGGTNWKRRLSYDSSLVISHNVLLHQELTGREDCLMNGLSYLAMEI